MTFVLRFWTKKTFHDEVRTHFNYEHYLEVLKARNIQFQQHGYDYGR
jgi:hypothetical protein